MHVGKSHPAALEHLPLLDDAGVTAAALGPDGDPAALALRLVEWANTQGGRDNITVIVIASAPQTYAMLVIPIGRDDMAATGKAIIEQLKVAKDV